MDAELIISKLKDKLNFKKDYELAKYLGVSNNTISSWKKRNTLNLELLVAKCENININAIYNDSLDLFPVTTIVEEPIVGYNNQNIMNVPLVNQYAYAGFLDGYFDETYINQLPTIPFEVDRQYKGNYFAFEIRGDSMNDGSIDSLLDRDIVLCREVGKHLWTNKLHIAKWDFVLVHKEDGIIAKRIINHNTETGELTLHSLNPDENYPDYTINISDLKMILNIVAVKRTRRR